MSTMISEVYDAFRAAGVPNDKAWAAAEALSSENLATKADINELNPHISPSDAKIAPDFFRLRAPANESIVILLVE